MALLFQEIVEGVRNGQKCLRPTTELSCEEEVTSLMKRCWAEDPADRPDFTSLKATIRRLNKKHTISQNRRFGGYCAITVRQDQHPSLIKLDDVCLVMKNSDIHHRGNLNIPAGTFIFQLLYSALPRSPAYKEITFISADTSLYKST
ncbi:hypothetical protein J6590_014349 [Homalodisca vitripennis]|nr:hypothetical protein J6590_014349 [Homalodisca vitripennis]